MNRDALAFFRILPAGAADIGAEVSRQDLREAGAGDWVVKEAIQDDVSCVFGPGGLEGDFDEVMPLAESKPRKGEVVTELRFKQVG